MRGRVDLFQRADRHLRVDLRGFQVLVAEDRLDEADIRAAFVHECRHRVAAEMARAGFAEIHGNDVLAHGQATRWHARR